LVKKLSFCLFLIFVNWLVHEVRVPSRLCSNNLLLLLLLKKMWKCWRRIDNWSLAFWISHSSWFLNLNLLRRLRFAEQYVLEIRLIVLWLELWGVKFLRITLLSVDRLQLIHCDRLHHRMIKLGGATFRV